MAHLHAVARLASNVVSATTTRRCFLQELADKALDGARHDNPVSLDSLDSAVRPWTARMGKALDGARHDNPASLDLLDSAVRPWMARMGALSSEEGSASTSSGRSSPGAAEPLGPLPGSRLPTRTSTLTPQLTREQARILKDWFSVHIKRPTGPYPGKDEKRQLSKETGATMLQVHNWFLNARRRWRASQFAREQGSKMDVSSKPAPAQPADIREADLRGFAISKQQHLVNVEVN